LQTDPKPLQNPRGLKGKSRRDFPFLCSCGKPAGREQDAPSSGKRAFAGRGGEPKTGLPIRSARAGPNDACIAYAPAAPADGMLASEGGDFAPIDIRSALPVERS
jgi:hypothetical protein